MCKQSDQIGQNDGNIIYYIKRRTICYNHRRSSNNNTFCVVAFAEIEAAAAVKVGLVEVDLVIVGSRVSDIKCKIN